jgi:hypothetical protein
MITANPTRTAERRERLAAYLQDHVMRNDAFICASEEGCRASRCGKPFYEGQAPHLGRYYDLKIDGVERRIVTVGQEYGSGERLFSLDQRTDEISKTGDISFGGRNPQMRGTTSLLRLLIGRDTGHDKEGEALPVAPGATIFDGFAHVNALMCSAIDEWKEGDGPKPGQAGPLMYKNCTMHLIQILTILEPTIIVAQGISDVAKWLSVALGVTRQAGHQTAMLNGKRVEFFAFVHPSARGYLYWGKSPSSKYLMDTVTPSIRQNITRTVSPQ